MNCLRVLFVLFLFSLSVCVNAQVPSDLSKVKASQISDNQLQQYLSQSKASGLTVDQLESEFLRRGLPPTEMAELKIRIQQLNNGEDEEMTTETPSSTTPTSKSTK